MSELAQAIEEMRNMRESYDALADAVAGATAGKPELAAAISAKGVPATTQDGLTDMAAKVRQIPQELNTGVSDFEQVIAPSPYIWNVYSVANDLMKDILPAYIPTYMSEYKQRYGANSFFVGEYYLGYDTLPLTGADGYLTCDGDFYTIADGVVTHTAPDGTVETYSAEEIIHTWHDSESGRCNRWVAFFYLANAYSFINVTSSICPRRAALCGECTSFIIQAENRLTDVWVIGTLGHLEGGITGSTWNTAQVIRHYERHTGMTPIYSGITLISLVMPDLKEISGAIFASGNASQFACAKYISLPNLETLSGRALFLPNENSSKAIESLNLPKLKTCQVPIVSSTSNVRADILSIKTLELPSIEELNITSNPGGYNIDKGLLVTGANHIFSSLTAILIPKLKRITSGYIFTYNTGGGYISLRNLIDIEVGEIVTNFNCKYWNPTYVLADADEKAQLIDNIKNHILARVSDVTGGTQLVFTVSTNMFNAIATENIEWQDETMTLADAFLTKNWLLAGA